MTTLLIALVVWATGVDQAKPQAKRPAPALLSIEAGVLTPSGDIKRVARTRFLLLDADFSPKLAELMKGSKPGYFALKYQTFDVFRQMAAAGAGTDLIGEDMKRMVEEGDAFLKEHTVATATTDFDGKATFTVRPGRYFLLGLFRVMKSTIVWNLPVTLKSGPNGAILDQDNGEQ
jgi:hypothetical protein